MRWQRGWTSRNVEDRRGVAVRRGIPLGLGGMAVLLVLSLIFGRDLISPFIGGGGGGYTAPATSPGATGGLIADELGQFVSFVFDDAQSAWRGLRGSGYRDARMVLFTDAVE